TMIQASDICPSKIFCLSSSRLTAQDPEHGRQRDRCIAVGRRPAPPHDGQKSQQQSILKQGDSSMNDLFQLKPQALATIALSLAAALAHAANTGELPCKTTAECEQQAIKAGAIAKPVSSKATSKNDEKEDQFYWIGKINKASAVMLTEEKIVDPEMGTKLASGVAYSLAQSEKPDGKRPKDVLQIEKIITDEIGPDASLIHTGRSRQDMYATYRMAKLRNQVLDYSDALNKLRTALLAAAAKNVNTIVPAYTNGVQAMPISYAHYLLAYEASFARDAQRIHELYKRMNLSAMGTAVLANSSWPLN